MNDSPSHAGPSAETPVASPATKASPGSDVIAQMLRELADSLSRAESRRQLSRTARQPREFPRQRAAADAPVPARGERGFHRAGIRQGLRPHVGVRPDSNVGLMHATMSIFNAWCNRVPMSLLGAHGPGRRRQAPALDRPDTHGGGSGGSFATTPKWDDQPGSITAALEALARGCSCRPHLRRRRFTSI